MYKRKMDLVMKHGNTFSQKKDIDLGKEKKNLQPLKLVVHLGPDKIEGNIKLIVSSLCWLQSSTSGRLVKS